MISRPLLEGFRGVARHWAMALSSALAVTVTLVIVSIFTIFTYHLTRFTTNFEEGIMISVMIDFAYESPEEELRIRNQIAQIEGVNEITYYTKEQEYEYFLEMWKDDERTQQLFEGFRDDNYMHDAYYVTALSGYDISLISEQIKTIEGVSNVSYGGQSTLDIVSALQAIRRFGSILVTGLCILAVFLIQNTIKLTIYARQDEIDIMRNVGATNMFIRSPFLIEGVIIGAIGALIPIILTVWMYNAFYKKTDGIIISSMFRLAPPNPYIAYESLFLLGMGVGVGLVGSLLSVNRYLRWKR